MGGRSDRKGPQERARHLQGRNAVQEPGAARLAGAAGGPRRERRSLPRTGGHKQHRRAAASAAISGAAAPNKGRHPGGAGGSAASNRASSAGRQLSSAPKPGAPPARAAGVPAGPRTGAAPCPASAGSVRHQPRSISRGVAGRSPAEGVRRDPRARRQGKAFPQTGREGDVRSGQRQARDHVSGDSHHPVQNAPVFQAPMIRGNLQEIRKTKLAARYWSILRFPEHQEANL